MKTTDIEIISFEEMNKLLTKWRLAGVESDVIPHKAWIAESYEGKFIALENLNGQCWDGEFDTMWNAIGYILGCVTPDGESNIRWDDSLGFTLHQKIRGYTPADSWRDKLIEYFTGE